MSYDQAAAIPVQRASVASQSRNFPLKPTIEVGHLLLPKCILKQEKEERNARMNNQIRVEKNRNCTMTHVNGG